VDETLAPDTVEDLVEAVEDQEGGGSTDRAADGGGIEAEILAAALPAEIVEQIAALACGLAGDIVAQLDQERGAGTKGLEPAASAGGVSSRRARRR
jgi:hypothetical protein